MSLKKCKECGIEISSKAKKCPHCGVQITSRTTKLIAVLFALVIIGVIFGGTNNPNSVTYSTPTNNSLSADQNLSIWLKANPSDKDLLCSLMVKKIDANITANNLCSCKSEASTGNNLNLSIAETAASCAIIMINS